MSEKVVNVSHSESAVQKHLKSKGTGVEACYQCLRCSAGCPMLEFMDTPPHRLIRMVQFGLDETVLRSNTIWMCASCQTCTTRCPNEVEIAHLMDVLRQEALRRKIPCPEPAVEKFHRAFVKEIKRGRVHELSMIGRFKMSTGRFTDDMKLGMDMFKKGRIKLMPYRFTGAPSMKAIFKAADKGE